MNLQMILKNKIILINHKKLKERVIWNFSTK